MQPESSSGDVVVHLIHGTWPSGWFRHCFLSGNHRETLWYEAGSSFQEAVQRAARRPVRFIAHPWSGNNSAHGREAGARVVSASLQDAIEKAPASEHVVIAHSHGGNVALRAIPPLPPTCIERIRAVATLATPFVRFTPRPLNRHEEILLTILPVGLGAAISVLYILLVRPPMSPWMQIALGIGPASVLALLAVRAIDRAIRMAREGVLQSESHPDRSAGAAYPPIFALSTSGDEAALAIESAGKASATLRIAWTVLRACFGNRFSQMAWAALALLHLSHWWESADVAPDAWLRTVFPAFAVLTTLVLCFVAIASSLAMIVLGVATGVDLAPLALIFRVKVERTPDPTFTSTTYVPLDLPRKIEMWHSLHAYTEVREYIADLISHPVTATAADQQPTGI